ncbi:hypothetical protein IWX90DRAFT_95467 [Phyllosticta citrichinensis]|uniref:Uncharacterized protein n=1 Tax=Phyllosticta citrichinensis TaxID=1130410 RepID=A0ABR1XEU2_9PEZI
MSRRIIISRVFSRALRATRTQFLTTTSTCLPGSNACGPSSEYFRTSPWFLLCVDTTSPRMWLGAGDFFPSRRVLGDDDSWEQERVGESLER